jgi:hypothetical protein
MPWSTPGLCLSRREFRSGHFRCVNSIHNGNAKPIRVSHQNGLSADCLETSVCVRAGSREHIFGQWNNFFSSTRSCLTLRCLNMLNSLNHNNFAISWIYGRSAIIFSAGEPSIHFHFHSHCDNALHFGHFWTPSNLTKSSNDGSGCSAFMEILPLKSHHCRAKAITKTVSIILISRFALEKTRCDQTARSSQQKKPWYCIEMSPAIVWDAIPSGSSLFIFSRYIFIGFVPGRTLRTENGRISENKDEVDGKSAGKQDSSDWKCIGYQDYSKMTWNCLSSLDYSYASHYCVRYQPSNNKSLFLIIWCMVFSLPPFRHVNLSVFEDFCLSVFARAQW